VCEPNHHQYQGHCRIDRGTSEDVVAYNVNDFFDFIHLDANHGYDPAGEWGIVQDLELWYPKLKSGGLFSGHDYYNAACRPNGTPNIVANEADADLAAYGVKKAVDEFAAKIGVEVQVTTRDKLPSWWWVKP
jgi:hypothetical protein